MKPTEEQIEEAIGRTINERFTDSDIATIEQLHDLLVDQHGHKTSEPLLEKSRKLTDGMYKSKKNQQKMIDSYHKDQTYFTRSYLVNYLISPLHAKTELKAEETSTPALLYGQAYHALLAGSFHQDFFVLDEAMRPESDKTMASNLNKAWKEKLSSGVQKMVTLSDFMKMERMQVEMHKSEYVKRMNAFAFTQEEVIYKVIDGYKVKCKPDVKIEERKLLADWKTTAELPINEYQANHLVRKWNLHFQAAFYCDITGMDHMLFFFQEKVEPFDVVPVLIRKDSPLMEEGRELWKRCAKQATECHRKGEWLGIASVLTDGCITL